MTDEQIDRLGEEYAELSGYEEDYILKDIARAYSEGMKKGMESVLNTLEYARETITRSLTDAILNLQGK